MIPEADVSQALGEHLAGMTDCPPIAWENRDFTPERPYLVVQMVRVSRRSPDLNGSGGTYARGYMQVTVVSDVDVWANAAERLADAIAARFPKALRLTAAGGKVTITDAADVKQGFRDGPNWRLAVQVPYSAVEPD